MPAGLLNRGFLDGKTCWKMWHVTEGSLGEVQKKFLADGKINEKTGRAATKSGIQKAAFSWAIMNQKEARKDLEFAWAKLGHILTDEDWKTFLVNAGKLVFHQRPRKLQEFLIGNDLKDRV